MPGGNPNWQPGGKDHRPARGAGWGGPASGGKPVAFDTDNQPPPEAKSVGWMTKSEMHQHMSQKRKALADKLLHLAENAESEVVQMNAINSIFDRLDGKATQAIGGANGDGPVLMTFRWATEQEVNGS